MKKNDYLQIAFVLIAICVLFASIISLMFANMTANIFTIFIVLFLYWLNKNY